MGGPLDLPFDLPELFLYRAQFAALDPDLPLALLPVRIETFFTRDPQHPELLIRIHPDVIHADGHQRGLTPTEQKLGRAFWDRTWRAGGAAADLDAAFGWLAGQVGPWRAAWIASQLAPTNQQDAPAASVPDDHPLDPPPRFPSVDTVGSGAPVYAKLLPTRWAVAGFIGDNVVGPWLGEAIPDPLAIAPGLVDGADDVDGRGLLDAQGLGWTHDPEEAARVGMMVRIDLDAVDSFTELVVFGIRPGDGREDIEALLEAHRYTHGLDLIPQGTPTNATETAASAWHPARPDPGALRSTELEPVPSGARPEVAAEGDLFRMLGSDALSVALGLGRDNALDRGDHAAIGELCHAESMNRALWPATLDHYFTAVLGGVIDSAGRSWLRDWASTFVRGGGPLPTLLIGSQPYGVIPASSIKVTTNIPSTNIEHLEGFLAQVKVNWMDSRALVPRLDHNAADAPPGGESEGDLAAAVSQVIGSVPHPTAFRLRAVDAMRGEYSQQYEARLFKLGFDALLFPDPSSGQPFGDSVDNWAFAWWDRLVDDLDDAFNAQDQLRVLEDASVNFNHASGADGVDFTAAQIDHLRAMGGVIDADLIPLVAAHIERIDPIISLLGDEDPSFTGKMGDDDDPEAFFSFYGEEGTEATWTAPLVASGTTPEHVAELVAFLETLRGRVDDGTDSGASYPTHQPLLRHLLNRSADQATSEDARAALVAGLDGLIDVVSTDSDSIATLERLMRETLGVSSYRLDAWYTGVAAWRLDNKRANKPRGIQVGAYGFVVDLRPREGRASEGHIMTPTLSHATTAAVLRSGWSAFGGTSETSGLAVNLSSDRIRRAKWIIDGVRRGQDLAELLGSRFERRLHDGYADGWVEPIRALALEAAGNASPPNAIVDGLLLARAQGGGPDLNAAEKFLAQELPMLLAAPDRPPGDPEPALDALVGDLDAAADAAVAQSVFSLVEGNIPEATATLTAAGSGEIEFPQLRFIDTPKTAATITHRLIAFVDPAQASSWPGATKSGRSLGAPGIEAWVADLLGDPARIPFTVSFLDTDTGATLSGPIRRSIADLGLSALDLLFLAPAGEDPGLGLLGAVLTAWAEQLRPQHGVSTSDVVIGSRIGDPSLDDVVAVARSMRALVANATDLDGRSLAEAGAVEVPAGVDLDELASRIRSVVASLAELRDGVVAALKATAAEGDGTALRLAMLRLIGFQFTRGVPRARATGDLVAEATRLVDQITDRLDSLQARVDKESQDGDSRDDDARRRALTDRLAFLVGHKMPWAPLFHAENGAQLQESFARRRLAGHGAATAWLAASGRVDPGAQRLRVVVDMVEAMADRTMFRFAVAQLPDHASENWVAVKRPHADGRGRLCLLTTGAPARPGNQMAGLVLGTWSEPIPAGKQTPGLAFHFDAPSARAPQAILLCVAKPESGFSFDFVRDTIKQTLDLARCRMVGPETLRELGQYLPASYLAGDLYAGDPA